MYILQFSLIFGKRQSSILARHSYWKNRSTSSKALRKILKRRSFTTNRDGSFLATALRCFNSQTLSTICMSGFVICVYFFRFWRWLNLLETRKKKSSIMTSVPHINLRRLTWDIVFNLVCNSFVCWRNRDWNADQWLQRMSRSWSDLRSKELGAGRARHTAASVRRPTYVVH